MAVLLMVVGLAAWPASQAQSEAGAGAVLVAPRPPSQAPTGEAKRTAKAGSVDFHCSLPNHKGIIKWIS